MQLSYLFLKHPFSARKKFWLAIACLLLLSSVVRSVDKLSLSIEHIAREGWIFDGIEINLAGLDEQTMDLGLLINNMVLPEPFNHLTLIDIQCSSFIYQPGIIACNKGHAKLKSDWLEPSRILFSFTLKENNFHLAIDQLKTAGGTVSLNASQENNIWHMEVNAQGLEASKFKNHHELSPADITNGKIDLKATLKGEKDQLHHLAMFFSLSGIDFQTTKGKFACEALDADLVFNTNIDKGIPHWQSKIVLKAGAIYAEPVFLEVDHKTQPITISLTGRHNRQLDNINIETASLEQSGIVSAQAEGQLFSVKHGLFKNASLVLLSEDLETFSRIYLEPFLSASALEGMSLTGKVDAKTDWVSQSPVRVNAVITELGIHDSRSRIGLEGGNGTINWSDNINNHSQSSINWEKLHIFNVPLDGSRVSLSTDETTLLLNQPVHIPLLGGSIKIYRFDWQGQEVGEPDVHFKGNLEDVSLELLTKALHWTPMSGTISGDIPGVRYHNNALQLDGEIKIGLFDGLISFNNLVSSGLFSNLPQLSADVEIDNLDLNMITHQFEFGSIEGRISGYIRDLYLENWDPVTFYAWLGTPEMDRSRHRISQKAVENIATLGGGGASGLVSRTFLRFFKTFGYDKLGIGCYLYKGVCQLMSMEAATNGYYIIKGRGLPRIDVIGYNSRLDWKVLLKRLKRIDSTNQNKSN